MLKRQKQELRITKEHLQWQNSEQGLAYPIFIRDPAQQRQFLSTSPPEIAIDLHFESTLCTQESHIYLGQTFIQNVPEKTRLITLQDIFTRHGYRIGKICIENQPIYHWSSRILGSVFWGLGSMFAIYGLWLFLTTPAPPITTMPPENRHTPTIPPALLQKIAALPGAIDDLYITPQKGHIRAYIPKENQEAFGVYLQHIGEEFPFQWQHQLLGKTRDALVWKGVWTLP